jgi:hypothetical protein
MQRSPDSTHKPKMSLREVLRNFEEQKSIENRTLPSSVIIAAIRWADTHVAKDQQHKLFLQVYDSIIEDDPTDKSADLGRVSAEEVPLDLRWKYEEGEVAIVRFDIRFQGCIIKSSSLIPFGDTIFLGGANFSYSTFEADADFSNDTFAWGASFQGSTFKEDANFAAAIFQSGVSFSKAEFQGNALFPFASVEVNKLKRERNTQCLFNNATFKKDLIFSNGTIEGSAYFSDTKFNGDVYFIDLNQSDDGQELQGNLIFTQTEFLGRVYFTNAKVDMLSFFPKNRDKVADHSLSQYQETPSEVPTRLTASPSTLAKRAKFTNLTCNGADFREVEFRDEVDFNYSRFLKTANFNNASFDGGVSFYGAEFPWARSSTEKYHFMEMGLFFDGVNLAKATNLKWEQFDGKLNTKGSSTWKKLEELFKQSGDLEGQNEALYRRHIDEGHDLHGWAKRANRFEQWFWGYGVRPWRLVAWLLVGFLLLSVSYWTQTASLANNETRFQGQWKRIRAALEFSARTSWTLGYGYRHSRTPLFKTITLIHSLGFKVMMLCLIKVLANISPLLNELIGKLLTG